MRPVLTAWVSQVGNLIIYNPRREDSGNYSCAPSNLDSASVVLHVLSGESTSPFIRRSNYVCFGESNNVTEPKRFGVCR